MEHGRSGVGDFHAFAPQPDTRIVGIDRNDNIVKAAICSLFSNSALSSGERVGGPYNSMAPTIANNNRGLPEL